MGTQSWHSFMRVAAPACAAGWEGEVNIKEIAERHATACVADISDGWGDIEDKKVTAETAPHIERAIREAAAPLVEALEVCHSAMDSMMGDTDIDGDDSPEMLACQQAMAVLAEWRAK